MQCDKCMNNSYGQMQIYYSDKIKVTQGKSFNFNHINETNFFFGKAESEHEYIQT